MHVLAKTMPIFVHHLSCVDGSIFEPQLLHLNAAACDVLHWHLWHIIDIAEGNTWHYHISRSLIENEFVDCLIWCLSTLQKLDLGWTLFFIFSFLKNTTDAALHYGTAHCSFKALQILIETS
jgi:hypothetical protein